MVELAHVIAFSGSRHLNDWQRTKISAYIALFSRRDPPPQIVTGGCHGVDTHAAQLAHLLGLQVHTVLPSNHVMVDPQWRDHCTTYEQLGPGTTYRDRNIRLVELGEALLALPEYPEDDRRARASGTWQTIRLARKAGKPLQILIPYTEALDVRAE